MDTTVSWKGPQGVDPVVNNNWSLSSGSGGGLDGDGYFQQYKPYYNSSTIKTFDKNRNIISAAMQVTVDTNAKYLGASNPNSFYDNHCDGQQESHPGDDYPVIPQARTWSNHFCAAGYAYEPDAAGTYPVRTNTYCSNEDDTGSPYYFKEDEGHPNLDCDSSPLIWPKADPDGCFEGLMIPNGVIPNQQGTVNQSAHTDLVRIMQFANTHNTNNGKSWLQLPYDGAWTMSYKAWDFFKTHENYNTIITVTPPNGYTCRDFQWFNSLKNLANKQDPIVRNNVNGTCEVEFNPKEQGNLIVLEINRNKTQSCTVQFEDIATGTMSDSITTSEPFNVHIVGNSSDALPTETPEKTRLFFALPGFAQLDIDGNPNNDDSPPGFVETEYNGDYSYHYTAAECLANSEQSCSMTATIVADDLPVGEYEFFCDSPDGEYKCSGSPLCSYNGTSTFNCGQIYGIDDCVDDSTFSPTDHGTAKLECTRSCDACSLEGEDDGCGGSCSAGAHTTITAVPPQLIKPELSQEVTENLDGATEYYFPISWGAPADTTNIDGYEYMVYKEGAFATAQAAYDANQAHQASTSPPQRHPDVLFHAYTTKENLGFGAVPAPDASQYAMGRDLTAAVRAANSLYGVCSAGYVYSDWDTKNFTLVGTVSGTIYDDPADIGSTSTPVSNFPSGSQVNVWGITLPFTRTSTAVGSVYSVSSVPYYHPMWPYPFIRGLTINNTDPSNWFVCSGAPGQTGANTEECTIADQTSAPKYNAHFYVKSMNLAFDSWWQTWGGSIFGKTSLGSSIPESSSPCENSAYCFNHLVAFNRSFNSLDPKSAGVAVTGASSVETGIDSRYSEASLSKGSAAENPRATNQEIESATIENYTYFVIGSDLGIPTSPTGSDTHTAADFRAKLASDGQTVADADVVYYNGSLTLDLGAPVGNPSAKVSISGSEKYVVFVPGDLTITGPPDYSSTGNHERLISVAKGGYLAFIVGGDITVASSIGYDDPDGDFADEEVAQLTTPNLEGVYIASGELIIDTNNAGDFKFVGAGTFVGWRGVQLPRKFDGDSSGTHPRRELNNRSPTELFIHRPDFVTNTPAFMMKPQLTWQEVR